MSQQLTKIESAQNIIYSQEGQFNALSQEYDNRTTSFRREAEFALQILKGNDFLLKVAMGNPDSLQSALLNVAATGLSLNPVDKQAYLVPRGGKLCLDISYMGMANVATQTDSIKWVKAEIVYEEDTFRTTGPDSIPVHEFNPFSKDRGEKVGVYCVIKTADGDYLTEVMSIDEVYKSARSRSESYKKNSGPWVTDENEMIKKTVVKRASKLWPKASKKLKFAVDVANQAEGITFLPDGKAPATDEQLSDISTLFKSIPPKEGVEDPEYRFMEYLTNTFKREINETRDLTTDEAKIVITTLKQWAAVKK